jgi:hypothetical protein
MICRPVFKFGTRLLFCHYGIRAIALIVLLFSGCATTPDFTGVAVNTPKYYRENKAFYGERLPSSEQHSAKLMKLDHLYKLDPSNRENDLFRHNNPISVVLQSVRLPSDLPTGATGTIDVAVVLDIHTSTNRGLTTLMAFYQRDVPPGQELNFANLLVYADPMWDEANPPYFRIRIIDVASERNRNTQHFFDKFSNLSGQISGLVPHPAIPLVAKAIEAAGIVLNNRQNKILLDYQIQFYSQRHIDEAGGAILSPLVAGEWYVVGRAQDQDSTFWETSFEIDRETGKIVTFREAERDENGEIIVKEGYQEVHVPYVKVALVKADAQVPKLVLDRSETLMALLSTTAGKSDVDSLEQVISNLISAVDAFSVERRLRKYRSVEDLRAIINRLKLDEEQSLNVHEKRRLIFVMNAVSEENFNTPQEWTSWWDKLEKADLAQYEFAEDDDQPLGILFRKRRASGGN